MVEWSKGFKTDGENMKKNKFGFLFIAICLSAFMSACGQRVETVEEPCEKENHHLDALVSKLKKVHEAITLSPDSSVTFDFSVSDSAIVKVEHSSISWKFTALKAGTTSITLVRTTPGIQTCSYTQAINISE